MLLMIMLCLHALNDNAMPCSLQAFLPASGPVPLELINAILTAYGRYGMQEQSARLLQLVRMYL